MGDVGGQAPSVMIPLFPCVRDRFVCVVRVLRTIGWVSFV
jgi:hypothetical protein